jgi:Ca2+-binding RTX toxin-like protein
MRLSLLFATALTIALVWAAPASAGTVCNIAGIATFAAADVGANCPSGANSPSEVNSLSVSTNPAGDIVFTDANAAMTDGDGAGGCSVSGNTGTCPGTTGFVFNLGAGDDTAAVGAVASGGISTGGPGADHLQGGPLADLLNGGGGDDVLEGGEGDDTLLGGIGVDTLRGGAGSDVLRGDDGPDTLEGGPGRDYLAGGTGDDTESGGDDGDVLDGGGAPGCDGGEGSDILNGDGGDDALCGGTGPGAPDNDALNGGAGEDSAYYLRSTNVSVSLDNVANDGAAGEADNVHADVEDVTSGSGADTLTGSDARNVLDGGPGPDNLSGLGGNDVLADSGGDSAADRLDGGAGDDSLAAGAGPDVYVGGDGEDAVTDYAARTFSVSVTLDGVADDGAAGEGDNVGADVEDVTGGSAADTLTGNAADNELVGGAGDDTINGGDGNDGLSGGAGRDTIDGGGGRDDLEGGGGADTLKLRDWLTDRANCGGGTDAVQGEARDDIAGNCENVSIAPPTAVVISSVQVTRAGFVVVKVGCRPVERSCSGAIIAKTVRRVAGRFIKLGQVNYRLREGQSKVFKAKIGTKDRRALKRARRVKVRVFVTNANGDTGVSTSTTKLATVTTRGL